MSDGAANTARSGDERDRLETEIARDIRVLTAVSEQIGHVFAHSNKLRPNDFRALMHAATAEVEGAPLTAGQLGALMGVSPAAVTYLVERMTESGHLERAADSADRRRVLLHYTDHGMSVAGAFFTPLGSRMQAALAELPDTDLDTAHRVMIRIITALRGFATEIVDSPADPDTAV